jgi:alpha-amylase
MEEKSMKRRRSVRSRLAALAAAIAILGAAQAPLAAVASPPAPAQLRAHGAPPGTAEPAARQGDVIANLFEWNWPSVARECATVLGPAGYGGVQVAPPQDSLSRSGPAPVHPWWEVYQPVDYNLTSRMGTEDQFKAMVATCRAAGVKVYVDAVINHMTGQGDTSYGGVHYAKYDYPGLYSFGDFHHYPADCPEPDGTIHDFNNYLEVTKCELVGLADLRTESDSVRDTLAGYLNKLLSYGVSGFRVDAAKHIGQTDLAAIEARLQNTVDGARPYLALEVVPGGPGKLAPAAFEGVGNLLGFDYATQIHDAFKSYTTPPGGNITDLQIFGEQSGLLPSDKELVFVENHDTERNGSTLSYKDGATNIIATEFMLAWPHGQPEVYASFAWNSSDDSPPSDAHGFITNTDCANGWVCTDRTPGVANMVGWHNDVGDAPVANWYDDGVNLIAFSRGDKGWIAINNETSAQTKSFATGLGAGVYCDIIHGALTDARSCSGPTVTVDASGHATVTIPAKDAIAFAAGDLTGTVSGTATGSATPTGTAVPSVTGTTTAVPSVTGTTTAVPSVTGTTTAVPSVTSTGTTAPTATSTQTAAPTSTTVPPTATGTAVPPTATNTAVPPTMTSTATAMPATATNTAVPPTSTSTPTALPVCQLFALPAFATVPRGGEQALLVDAAPNSAMTLTIKAGYPAQATLYTDSSLGSSGGFGVTLTGARVSGGYRYTFHVEASGLALLTFAIPHTARQGTVVIQVAAQEPCGLFQTVTTFQVRGRVTGAGASAPRATAGAVTLAIPLPRGDAPPANAAQLARRGLLQVTTRGRGASAQRVLHVTYHAHARPASTPTAGAAHTRTRPHTLFGVAVGAGT